MGDETVLESTVVMTAQLCSSTENPESSTSLGAIYSMHCISASLLFKKGNPKQGEPGVCTPVHTAGVFYSISSYAQTFKGLPTQPSGTSSDQFTESWRKAFLRVRLPSRWTPPHVSRGWAGTAACTREGPCLILMEPRLQFSGSRLRSGGASELQWCTWITKHEVTLRDGAVQTTSKRR